MNRGQLLGLHAKLTDDARKLMVVKNQDYGTGDDPFRNFRRRGLLGILVRMEDKLARLETFVERGDLKVVDEQVRDTVIDIINYAVLFEGYNDDANGKGSDHGNKKVPPFTWPSYPELVAGRVDLVPGDPGGGTGGPRRGEGSEALFSAFNKDVHVKSRTGAGGRRRRTVDKQHRHRTIKGKP